MGALLDLIARGGLGARRVRTPTVLQMEAVECGAAALGSVLAYHGCHVSLERLRVDCGVSRDGSKASHILRAARKHGMVARAFKAEPAALAELPLPLIIHWNFNHFVVLEGLGRDRAYLNDPACGPRVVSAQQLDRSFTGVALAVEPPAGYAGHGAPWRALPALARRLRGSRAAVAFLVIVGLSLVVPGLLIPAFARVFVDDVLIDGKRDWLAALIAALAVTAAVQGGLTALQRRALARLDAKLAMAGASQFLWHALRLPTRFYLTRAPGELAARVTANDRVAALLSGRLAATFIAAALVVFYAALMVAYDGVLTAVGVAVVLLDVAALRLTARARVDAHRRLAQARGAWTGTAMSGLALIETLKATAAEDELFARWAGHYAKMANASREVGTTDRLLGMAPAFLGSASAVLVLGVGGARVMEGALSVGMLIAFQSLMAGLIGPVNDVLRLASSLDEVQGDMRRLDDVLAHELDPQAARAPEVPPPMSPVKLRGLLSLEEVSFGYSPVDPPLVRALSLTLAPGARVALVGRSGSGKSTVARLIAGLYAPWSGRITFDGRPREALSREVLASSLGVVNQDIFLFEGTIRDNLTLWDDTLPEARLVRAAKDACIHDDIVARPNGYDARVEEGGRNLSGGQRQRLEIARALVLEPSILVLDEATSALDPATERQLDENLRRRGVTCVIVAHRLSTVRDADEILVLDRGVVVERGTHAALYARDHGLYRQLIRSE